MRYHYQLIISLVFIFSIVNSSVFCQVDIDTIIDVSTKVITPTLFSPNKEVIRVGLVLSGGGAKGLAHIGVLKVLEKEGIYVDYVGGTSMGGLVGGLYAAGYSPYELDSITRSMPWNKLLSDISERTDLPLDEKKELDEFILNLPVKGFVPGLPKGLKKGQLVLNYINKLTWSVVDIKEFDKMPIPFYCVTTDLESGDAYVLDSGNFAMALRATMSIPSVFEPITIDNKVLIDGMVVNNFPVDIMAKNDEVDFIIGVDVGSPLYKAEEISSIFDILEQTSSYYGLEQFHKNVAKTDLYLKPVVADLSAMNFDDVEAIIKRGEDIALANIDTIRKLAKRIRNNKRKYESFRENKKSEMVYISKIEIEGLNETPKNMVIGRLGLKIPGVNNIVSINEAVDRLYSSNFFTSINYSLIKQLDSYILHLKIKEKKENMFSVGLNYNSDIGADVKLNFLFHNFVFKGSKTNVSFNMGNNPKLKFSFLSERGKKIGFGYDMGYETGKVMTYSEDYTNIEGSYFTRFAYLESYGNINYSNNAAFKAGFSIDFYNRTASISAIPLEDLGMFYTNTFASFTKDSYDNKYIPLEGSFFSAKVDAINVGRPYTGLYAKLKMSTIIETSDRLDILPKLFVGALWGGDKEVAYSYVLGGHYESNYANFVTMPGLPYSSEITNNVAIAYIDLRYRLFAKHFLYFKTASALSSTNFEELFRDPKYIISGSIGYSYNSPIGPIGFQVGRSNLAKKVSLFLNIGMDI